MKKRKSAKLRKEEIAEDWCFKCKDGGSFRICDYKDCLKVYHPECVGKDESFLDSGDRWTCSWHHCLICKKASKFHCLCCPNAVCRRCISAAEFVQVKGSKGFCNSCLKLALLVEENKDVDSDGGKVDFKDRDTVEFLFMEYWLIIKEEEGLTLESIQSAKALLKKGRNFRLDFENDESISEEEVSDYDDIGDEDVKRKKIKKQPRAVKSTSKADKKEFLGWGSKLLIEFLKSIGVDTTKPLSQYDVTSIINKYIQEKKLLHPEKKKKVVCDARLHSILRRKSVNKNKIYDLLEAHFAENLVQSEDDDDDDPGYISDDEDKHALVACKREKKSITKKKSQEKEITIDIKKTCFAAIVAQNMKLVYLRRTLVEELLKQLETFEGKVTGSFVRVKSDPNDYLQKNSHQLLQVTGIKKTLSSTKTEILLHISNRPTDFSISMLSDGDFTEEECEDLRQKVKDGLHKNPTIVEFEQKGRSLHENIMKHWIKRELAVLQHRIDQANEKGWRRELFEYMERRLLLQTSTEQSRLLSEVPEVIPYVIEPEPVCEDSLANGTQGRCSLSEMNPKGTSEIVSNILEGNKGPCSPLRKTNVAGLGDATGETIASQIIGSGSADDKDENGEAIIGNTAEKNRENLDAEMQHLSKEPTPEQLPQHQQSCTAAVQHESEVDDGQVDVKDGGASVVQVIELSDNEEENSAVAIGKDTLEDQESPCWHCVSPQGELKGPYSLSLLKRWSNSSTYALKFKVWKTGQDREEAIPMADVIHQSLGK